MAVEAWLYTLVWIAFLLVAVVNIQPHRRSDFYTMNRLVTKLLTVGPPMRRTADASDRRCVGPPMRRTADASDRRCGYIMPVLMLAILFYSILAYLQQHVGPPMRQHSAEFQSLTWQKNLYQFTRL